MKINSSRFFNPTTTVVASHHDLHGYSCQHQQGQQQHQQQLQLQLPTPTAEGDNRCSCSCQHQRMRMTHHQPTALSRVTTSKREGGHTRCTCSVFYFLLTSYYRRRGISSISTPGAPSPLIHSCFDTKTLPPPRSPHFDVARRVNTLVVTSKPNPGHGYGFGVG